MSTAKSITVAEIVRLMRASNEEGTIVNPRISPNPIWLATLLRARGATPSQAAKAARRLGWASDSAEDWEDIL